MSGKKLYFPRFEILLAILSLLIGYVFYNKFLYYVFGIYGMILKSIFRHIYTFSFDMYLFSGLFNAVLKFTYIEAIIIYNVLTTILILEFVADNKNGVKKNYGERLKDTKNQISFEKPGNNI